MQRYVSKLFPNVLKQMVRQSNYYTHKSAVRLALSSKRLDICSAQFANIFHLSKHPSIEGKICLEVGAGWVLSHALICYLLGAKKVIATDIMPCARPDTLSLALKCAITSIPRDILAPFSNHAQIRERLDKLLSIPKFSFSVLEELGIEYNTPINFATAKLNTKVDFIYSYSVLEHVPVDEIQELLRNLVECLNQGGTMIHCIHLEDHKEINKRPFDFLSVPEIQYTRKLQSARGNRIRSSEWLRIFGELEDTNTNLIYSYLRQDKALPENIDKSILYIDEHDLRTSHIGAYTRKE